MPLLADSVGSPAGETEVDLDRQWCTAFAAGIPDEDPPLYASGEELVVHPIFPVAPEWALIVAVGRGDSGLDAREARRGIHAAHALELLRPLRPGRVHLHAEVVAVDRTSAGATRDVLFTASDDEGVVWRTTFTSLFLGVELVGEPTSLPGDRPRLDPIATMGEPLATARSVVGFVDAHVYSACARIWNPIHTEHDAAAAAGLPTRLLHGTATLARAVSIAAGLTGTALADVRTVQARFRRAVPVPSTFEVRVLAVTPARVAFDVVDDAGRVLLEAGALGTTG